MTASPETQEHVETDLKTVTPRLVRLARRCLTDLYFLVTQVLYDYDIKKYGPLHQWMCKRVGKEKRQMWLLPRDHFKSTILTVGYGIQCMLNDPYESSLILSAKEEHAWAFSDEMRRHFAKNENLKALFGPWAMDKEVDSAGKWTTPAKAFFGGKRR